MNIENIEVKENILKINLTSNEETFFSLLKTKLEQDKDVDIVGTYKDHHLIEKMQFYLKTNKGIDSKKTLEKNLKELTKTLESLRV